LHSQISNEKNRQNIDYYWCEATGSVNKVVQNIVMVFNGIRTTLITEPMASQQLLPMLDLFISLDICGCTKARNADTQRGQDASQTKLGRFFNIVLSFNNIVPREPMRTSLAENTLSVIERSILILFRLAHPVSI